MSIKSVNLLPEIFRSEPNRKFLTATLDQLISEDTNVRLDSYIGRTEAPTWKVGDTYVTEPTSDRQQYQLESSVIVDEGSGNVSFYSSYIDTLKQIEFYGGFTNDHSRLFSNRSYSFDGLFDFDKFVNFTQYLWLPNGPPVIPLSASKIVETLDYTVTRSTATNSYQFTEFANSRNPIVTLTKGTTYRFHINQPGHKFWIQTSPGVTGTDSIESEALKRTIFGLVNNGDETGVVTFHVPLSSAQNNVLNATQVDTVDFATTLSYNQIQSYLMHVLAAKGGIDGVTAGLNGKKLIFINDDDSNDKWTDPGNFDFTGFDSDAYEAGQAVAGADRYGVFQIRTVDVGGGRFVLKLQPVLRVNPGEKVYVTAGKTNANVQFVKNLSGKFVVAPPVTAPLDMLYYQDDTDPSFYGVIKLVDPGAETIDVVQDILGTNGYTSPNGVTLSNGMCVSFDQTATPARYAGNNYIVEGVGKGIKLLSTGDFTVPETYAQLSSLGTPDYVTINRASRDLNAWSRSNRWFHRQTVELAAKYLNQPELVNLTNITRGSRPIIEFDPDIYLFEYGRQSRAPVDIIDFEITDAFSEVEGKSSYVVRMPHGVTRPLTAGTRIIFANDTDPNVRDRIYSVDYITTDTQRVIHLVSNNTEILPVYEVDTVSITSNIAYNFVPTVTFSKPLPGIGAETAEGIVNLNTTGVANVGVVYGGVNYIANVYIDVTTANSVPFVPTVAYKPFKQIDHIRLDTKGSGYSASNPTVYISNPNAMYGNVQSAATTGSSTTFTLSVSSTAFASLVAGMQVVAGGVLGGTIVSSVDKSGGASATVVTVNAPLAVGNVIAKTNTVQNVSPGDIWNFASNATAGGYATVALSIKTSQLITVNDTSMVDTNMVVSGGSLPVSISQVVLNTQAGVPARIVTTVPHGLVAGTLVFIRSIIGTVELNFTQYYAAPVSNGGNPSVAIDLYADALLTVPLDLRAATAYVSGGTITANTVDYGLVKVTKVLSPTQFTVSSPVTLVQGTKLVFVGVTAKAFARAANGGLYVATVTDPGSGYTATNPPVVTIPSDGGTSANITAITNDNIINYITVKDPGSGYVIKSGININIISNVDLVTANVTSNGTNVLYFDNPQQLVPVQPGWRVYLISTVNGVDTYTDFAQVPFAESAYSGPHPTEFRFLMDYTRTRAKIGTVLSVDYAAGTITLVSGVYAKDSDGVTIDLPKGSRLHVSAQSRFFLLENYGSSGAFGNTTKTGFLTAKETILSTQLQLNTVMGVQPGMMLKDLSNTLPIGVVVTAVDAYVNLITLNNPVTLGVNTPVEFVSDALLTTTLLPTTLANVQVTNPGKGYTSAPVVTIQPAVQSDPILTTLDTSTDSRVLLNVGSTVNIVANAKVTSTYDSSGNGVTTGSSVPHVVGFASKQLTSTTSQPQVILDISQTQNFVDIFVTFTLAAEATATVRSLNVQADYVSAQPDIYQATDTVLVSVPTNPSGQMSNSAAISTFNQFYFDGSSWLPSQQKTNVNQEPLFDAFDENGYSAADGTVYAGTKFTGTKIFGYKVGTGATDSVLNFPLSYQNNFNSVGDIQFVNYFQNDTFKYQPLDSYAELSLSISKFVLKQYTGASAEPWIYRNVWTESAEKSKQYQQFNYVYNGLINQFEVDVVPAQSATVPYIKVYAGGNRLPESSVSIGNQTGRTVITVDPTMIEANQLIIVKIFSRTPSHLGFYNVPNNLDLNPLNNNFDTLTLGQLRQHLVIMADNHYGVVGSISGSSNIRDIYNKNWEGAILQHTSPAAMASLFLVDKTLNIIESVKFAQREYNKFKNRFLSQSTKIQVNVKDIPGAVDSILASLMVGKSSLSPWYDSDMVPYGNNFRKQTNIKILDTTQRIYLIPQTFDPTMLQRRAVLIYQRDHSIGLNRLLITGIDFTFNTATSTITLSDDLPLAYTQHLVVVDYSTTVENYIPETPTKLGLYPKFTPMMFRDDTYREPVMVIQGHDGSITPAFGDYRDQLLLELELRIYNNIKVNFDNTLLEIYDTLPGKYRETDYSHHEFSQLLTDSFLTWIGNNKQDYSTNRFFKGNDPFTWNYNGLQDLTGELLPGYWRAIYQYFYDTDRPNTHPWEMLGFSQMPDWWEYAYGPGPYTGGNTVLWGDLEAGRILQGPRAGIDKRFARPGLARIVPVDENGMLKPPISVMVAQFNSQNTSSGFQIGDQGPVETAWRRSSDFPYAIQLALILAKPAMYLGTLFDNSRYYYDTALKQIVFSGTRQRLIPSLLQVPDAGLSTNPMVLTAGYSNWIRDYLTQQGIDGSDKLRDHLAKLDVRLSYKVAGFTSQNQLEIVAQQSSPGGSGNNIVIPNENYIVYLNKSAPVDRLIYSAVAVEVTNTGWRIAGYDTQKPYFTIIPSQPSNNTISVTEAGRSVVLYKDARLDITVNVPYGTEFRTAQEMADFLYSYQRWLSYIGFDFTEYNNELNVVQDWVLSIREYLTWSAQNFQVGTLLILSPIGSKITARSPLGVVDEITGKFNSNRFLDQNFTLIRHGEYAVTREDGMFTATAVTGKMIALADLSLVQYEHVLIFNNITVFKDVIYKPEIGNRQYRLRLTGYKTGSWTGQLSAPGYIYNSSIVDEWQPNTSYQLGTLIQYKNNYYYALEAVPTSTEFNFIYWKIVDKAQIKTGLLPNLSNNANKFRYIYDIDKIGRDANFQHYSNGLIGFRERTFLSQLGIEVPAQVRFYQGYIKQKGTKNAITALTSGQFDNIVSDVTFYEEWALRLGEYGSTQSNQYLEVTLDEQKFTNDPGAFVLKELDVPDTQGVVNFNPRTIYRTSEPTYTANILLPRADYAPRIGDNITAGYPSLSDIDGTIYDIADYQKHYSMVASMGAGFKVWVAVDFNKSWNVYRATETDVLLNTVTRGTGTDLLFTFEKPHNAKAGNLIAIKSFSSGALDGFYLVKQVNDNLSLTVTGYRGTTTFSQIRTVSGTGIYFLMESVRYNTVSDIIGFTPPHGWRNQDRVWIDNDLGTNSWGVFQKTDGWNTTRILPLRQGEDRYKEGYGAEVKLSADNQIILTGTPGYTAGSLSGLKVINPGSGYVKPAVTISYPTGPQGIRADFNATLDNGTLITPTVVSAGSGYTIAPNITITDQYTINANADTINGYYIYITTAQAAHIYVGDSITANGIPTGWSVTNQPNTTFNYVQIGQGPLVTYSSGTATPIQIGSATWVVNATSVPDIAVGSGFAAFPYGRSTSLYYATGIVSNIYSSGSSSYITANIFAIQDNGSNVSSGNVYTSWTLQTTIAVKQGTPVTFSRGSSGVILAKLSPTEIDHIEVVQGGSGFIITPTLVIDGGGGSGATAQAYLTNGVITSVVITNPGSGYTDIPDVIVLSNNPSPVTLRVKLKPTSLGNLVIDQKGTGYREPTLTFTTNTNDFANSAVANISFYPNAGVSSVTMYSAGSGYGNSSIITMANSQTGSGFVGNVYLGVISARLVSAGTGYVKGNVVTVVGGTVRGATYMANIIVDTVIGFSGAISSYHILSAGQYIYTPTNTSAVSTVCYADVNHKTTPAVFDLSFGVSNVSVISPGSGYNTTFTTANIYYPGGSGATGTVSRTINGIATFASTSVVNLGQGYIDVPTVTVTDLLGSGSGAVVEAVISTGQVKTFLRPDKTNYDLVETQLINPFSSDAREFGFAVDVGTINIVVSAPGTYKNYGGVLVSQSLGSTYISSQMIYPVDLTYLSNVSPRFGHSVALSRDENWLYIGAPGINKVYCYGKQVETYARVTIVPEPINQQIAYGTNLLGLQSAKEITVIGSTGKIYEANFDYAVSSNGLISFADFARISGQKAIYVTRNRLQTTLVPTVIRNIIQRAYPLLSRPSSIDQLLVYGATGRVFVPNKEFTVVGTNIIFLDDGFLTEPSIVIQQRSVYYTLVDTITPPDKVNSGANFGYSVRTDKLGYRIVIGSPDYAGTSPDGTTWSNVNASLTSTVSNVIYFPTASINSSLVGTVIKGPTVQWYPKDMGVLVTSVGTQNINGVVYGAVYLDTNVTVTAGDTINFMPTVASSGRAYSYSRSYEVVNSVGISNTFNVGQLRSVVAVKLDDIELTNLTDFQVLNNSVQLATTPKNGAKIQIDTNYFNLIQAFPAESVVNNGSFGATVDISPDNTSVVVGSPGYRDINYYNGAVYRYVNKGLYYGTVTNEYDFLQTNVAVGSTIKVNDKTITFSKIIPGIFTNVTVAVSTLQTSYVSLTSNVGMAVGDIVTSNSVPASAGVQVLTLANLATSNGTTFANVIVSQPFTATAGETIVFERYGDNVTNIQKNFTAAGLIGVTTQLTSDGHITIGSTASTGINSINILPGVGTALAGIGLKVYQLTQTIKHPRYGVPERFGTKVALDDTGLTVAIASAGGNTLKKSTFDNKSGAINIGTLFDKDTTRFVDNLNSSGAVYIYDYLSPPGETLASPGKLLYNQVLQNSHVLTGDNFGASIDINAGWALVGADASSYYSQYSGMVHLFINPTSVKGWSRLRQRGDRVDIDYINQTFIYSKKKQTILQQLDYFDPAKGKILGLADQELDYKSSYDPAYYNKGTRATVTISETSAWGSIQEGQTWWDLSQVRYIDYEQGDINYRAVHWGDLFPDSVVTVAEWVGSNVLPSMYQETMMDGVAKYPDDSAYVEDNYYDKQSGLIKTKYYYWVVGKSSIDNTKTKRTNSVITLEKLIANPAQQGIPYAAALASNAFAVWNVRSFLQATDTVLRVDYSKVLTQILSHNEWKLIQQGNPESYVPGKVIDKLVDSLSGENSTGAVVPDLKLSSADAYGINNLPRQSMIVNPVNATKVFVAFVNNVLSTMLITGTRDFVNLNKAEPVPASGVGFYDVTVDTVDQLLYIPSPPVDYKVLVNADATYVGNPWTIYKYTEANGFQLTRIQSYNTKRWWNYVDYYVAGYTQYTNIDFVVSRYNEIETLSLTAGNTVKVLNNSQGQYVVYVYNANNTLTPVIVESGTIQLSSALYDATLSGVGFDNASFDQVGFSTTQAIEIRNIFTALIDDIFINLDKVQTNNMFFALLNYILSEQVSIDWAIKTSFINVLHKLRKLGQFPNYILDNQTYYENYINEVKPYRTQVREYTLDYQGTDILKTGLSDFDWFSTYDPGQGIFLFLDQNNPIDIPYIQASARNDWLINYTYQLQNIVLTSPGSGYTQAPRVIIAGGGGSGATAFAVLGVNGVVGEVVLSSPGSGYTSTPTVEFVGGGGSGATAAIVISTPPGSPVTSTTLNKKVRSIYTALKFDRIGYYSTIRFWKPYEIYHPGDIVVIPSVNLTTFSNYNERALPQYSFAYRVIKTLLGRNNLDQTVFNDPTLVTRLTGSDFSNANDRIAVYLEPGSPDIAQIFSSVNSVQQTPSPVNDQVISLGKQWNRVRHSGYYPIQHGYQYAAVGDSALIGLSHDGLNWVIRTTTNTSVNIRDVFFYNKYTWVVVANGGNIMYTDDGLAWQGEIINQFNYTPTPALPNGATLKDTAQILDITTGVSVESTYSVYLVVAGNNGLILANPKNNTALTTKFDFWASVGVQAQANPGSYLHMISVDRGYLTDIDGSTYNVTMLAKSGYFLQSSDATRYRKMKQGFVMTVGVNGAIYAATYNALDDMMNGYLNGYSYANTGKSGNLGYPWQSFSTPAAVQGLGDGYSGQQLTGLAVSGPDTNWVVAIGSGGTLLWNQFNMPVLVQPGTSSIDAGTIGYQVIDHGFNAFNNFRSFDDDNFVAPLTKEKLASYDFNDITWDGEVFIVVGNNKLAIWGFPGLKTTGTGDQQNYVEMFDQNPVTSVSTIRSTASWTGGTNVTQVIVNIPIGDINYLNIVNGMLVTGVGLPLGAWVSSFTSNASYFSANVTFDAATVPSQTFQPVIFKYGFTSNIAIGTPVVFASNLDLTDPALQVVSMTTTANAYIGDTRLYFGENYNEMVQSNWVFVPNSNRFNLDSATGIAAGSRVRYVGKFAAFQWQYAAGQEEDVNLNIRSVSINTTTVEIDKPLLPHGQIVPIIAANNIIIANVTVQGVYAGNSVVTFDDNTGNLLTLTATQTLYANTTTLTFANTFNLAVGYTLHSNALLGIQGGSKITNVFNSQLAGVVSRLEKDIPRNVPGTSYPGTQVIGQEFTDTLSDSLTLDSNISSYYTDSLLGVRPEDIVVDGGKFIDTYASHAPEELVPAQIIDSLQMNVFTANVVNGQPDYGNVIAYKILTDYKLPSTYYRLTNVGTTKLAANLAYADTQVVVVSTDGLLDSGAVWINAERIVYRGIDRTHGLLLNLRRGTLRTSVPALHAVGSLVTDATSAQRIGDDFVTPITDNTVVSGNVNVTDYTTYLASLNKPIPQGKIWLQ